MRRPLATALRKQLTFLARQDDVLVGTMALEGVTEKHTSGYDSLSFAFCV